MIKSNTKFSLIIFIFGFLYSEPVAHDSTFVLNEDAILNDIVPTATNVEIGNINSDGYNLVEWNGNGDLVFNPNGSFSFFPFNEYQYISLDDSVEVSFTYTASDTLGVLSSEATITLKITGLNDSPESFDAMYNGTATEDGNLISGQVPEAIDVDTTGVNGGIDTLGYNLVNDVPEGDLIFYPFGQYDFNPRFDFQYLAEGEITQIDFTYTASDVIGEESNESSITIPVIGVNDAPISYDDSFQTYENSILIDEITSVYDVDSDGYNLNSFELVDNVDIGTLELNSDGTFEYDSENNFEELALNETDEVSFSYFIDDVHDELSDTSIITIIINGENDAPESYNLNLEMDEESILSSSVPTATDIDNDGINSNGYQLVEDVNQGNLIFNSDGSFVFDTRDDFQNLSIGETDEVFFTYLVRDVNGLQSNISEITITITGVNDFPITYNSNFSTSEDSILVGNVLDAFDIDNDGFDSTGYFLIDDVSLGSLEFNDDGSFIFNPENDYQYLNFDESSDITFSYSVTDVNNAVSDTSIITITVNGENDAPVILTNQTDLYPGFGDTHYNGEIILIDVDSEDLSYNNFIFDNVIIDQFESSISINSIFVENEIYTIRYSTDVMIPANISSELSFSFTVIDESQLEDSDGYYASILPNTAPEVVLSPEVLYAITGNQVQISSSQSSDLDNDIILYNWSVKPILRKENFIDLNKNNEFDNEPLFDLNNNGLYDSLYFDVIEAEILNMTQETATLIIPETFEDYDIEVELTITDSKGAKGYSSTFVRSINPKLVIEEISGNTNEISQIPFQFNELSNDPIYSLDVEFVWNIENWTQEENDSTCSSMDYFPPIIGDSISLEIPTIPNGFSYEVNDTEYGKLSFTLYSIDEDPLNNILNSNDNFGHLNIPLTGFHGESDRIYISKFELNEISYGANSNLNSTNGLVAILGEKELPIADYIVRNSQDEIIEDGNSIIYSGTKLYFEILSDGIGNGAQPKYYWDYETDGIVDDAGDIFGNITNSFTYSITGFDTIPKLATLRIETAYGCDTTTFSVDIDPLIPTLNMGTAGDSWNYDGPPADLILKINQVEDLEALDFVLDFNSAMINVVDVENTINVGVPLNISANYQMMHNVINNRVHITVYSDSTENFTFFDENADFPFAKIKYYALDHGTAEFNVIQFDVDEFSFLENLGTDSYYSVEIANPNEDILDCNSSLGGNAIVDQCGICSGGDTGLIPNQTQDCNGTCMPSGLLDLIDISIYDSTAITICENPIFGFNTETEDCEFYYGLESESPLAENNGVDLCGVCGGNNIELDGEFVGSNIDCNGYCSSTTPNASDQYGFCGCINDEIGMYPDINGICRNGALPLEQTGLCSEIFDDIDNDGEFTFNVDTLMDASISEFDQWGYKYLNFDPDALNDDGSCSNGIVINEFFFSPVQGTSVPDYIELLNMTPFDISMDGWYVDHTWDNEDDISGNVGDALQISSENLGFDPIIPAGQHYLISTGMPFYTSEGQVYFPGSCDEPNCNIIPNSLELNINLGMNAGNIYFVNENGIIDYLSYSVEAYWPVGSPFIGHSVELIEPYKSRKLSSNWLPASEFFENPYMATEDGEWEDDGNFNYGSPASLNIAYKVNHDEFCLEEINPDCNLTKYDCADVFNGLANIDLCGDCSGGSTGLQPSKFDEELGMCVGNPDNIDCACTCNGDIGDGAEINDCGDCVLGNAGSFDPNGLIVAEPTVTLNCDNDNDCEIWGMVCDIRPNSPNYCHHAENGTKDKCLTCRLGPECDGTNADICDPNFNVPEEFVDSNANGIWDDDEEFTDNNYDGIWNDGTDDCNQCLLDVVSDSIAVYGDSNGDGILSPCYDGFFDIDSIWVSNCPDWEGAFLNGCDVDCAGDVSHDGLLDDVNATQDGCSECIICETDDCTTEDSWENSCAVDFSANIDMNIPGIRLSWTPMLNYDFYTIYRDNQMHVDSLPSTDSTYIDEDVDYPNEYSYFIEAYNLENEYSNPSPSASAEVHYYGNLILNEYQFFDSLAVVNVHLDISHQLDTIVIQINENNPIDSLEGGIFTDPGFATEQNDNQIKMYPHEGTGNSFGPSQLELGNIYFNNTDQFCVDSGSFDLIAFDHVFEGTNEGCFNIGGELECFDLDEDFIVQIPNCDVFGCTDSTAFNYDENATVNDGSCQLPHYFVDIEPTDFFQNITISSTTNYLEAGDEIGIFDVNGIISTDCPNVFGELLVGSAFYYGENTTINAIRALPCPPVNPDNASLGFVPGNDIIIKIWRNSTQQEVVFSVSEQGHYFSGNNITIDQLNIPLYYNVEIEPTGNFQSITFNENIPGIEYGDHIGIFDFAGITSPDCPSQYDTLLVGSGYYMNEVLTIDAIRSDPCDPTNFDDPASPGFVSNNPIYIKIWRESEQMEYLVGVDGEQPTFGASEVIINGLLSNDVVVIPNQYQLHPIYPNPFNPVATIEYEIPELAQVKIEVFNVLGKRVETLINGMQSPGIYKMQWDGNRHSSGLYLIRMTSENYNFTEKVMLVK